jgi:hypothetical protein
VENSFEFRAGQDAQSGHATITCGLDRLMPFAAGSGRQRRPVKGLDRLSGCRPMQECIQAIKAVSKAAARPYASSPAQDSKGKSKITLKWYNQCAVNHEGRYKHEEGCDEQTRFHQGGRSGTCGRHNSCRGQREGSG